MVNILIPNLVLLFSEALSAKSFTTAQQSFYGERLDEAFTFTITGWPLENLNVKVLDDTFNENFQVTETKYHSQVPPKVELVAKFPNPIRTDVIKFSVVQTSSGSDTVLRNITVFKGTNLLLRP